MDTDRTASIPLAPSIIPTTIEAATSIPEGELTAVTAFEKSCRVLKLGEVPKIIVTSLLAGPATTVAPVPKVYPRHGQIEMGAVYRISANILIKRNN